MSKYPFKEIEPKWQAYWETNKTFKVMEDPAVPREKRRYVLDMFPYPSAQGLHVGHPEGYTATDIYCRFLRMGGYTVLHPMGFDAFGLPAENYAIRTGTHPAVTTRANIEQFTRQIKSLGFSYDWDRLISTCEEDYYRWTQWIFLKLYNKGLAYEAETPINWCPSCLTGLANEEVKEGRCERCGTVVTRKTIRQWILKITAYAEKLLQDLDTLDWPESVKVMQRNWIGKSEGGEVNFKLVSRDGSPLCDSSGKPQGLLIYTTRPDTLFGATYMVVAPEHSLVPLLTTPEQKAAVDSYLDASAKKSDLERTDLAKEKTGVFTGSYAVNPVNGEKIPVWVADYVLISYGTGAIMAVPAHDERDWDFARVFNLPVVKVVASKEETEKAGGPEALKDPETRRRFPELFEARECTVAYGYAINSGPFTGIDTDTAVRSILEWLAKDGIGKRAINYKLRDWVFSRQRYWGEPIPLVHCPACGCVPLNEEDLPLRLPEVESYQPTGTGESPLALITDWVETSCPRCGGRAKRETNTMPQWAGSCWYFLRYLDPRNPSRFASRDKIDYWMPVDLYVGGAEHAVLHLLYARFWHKVLYDLGEVNTPEPFQRLVNQGMITSFAYQRANKTLVGADAVTERAPDVFVETATGAPLERVIAKMSKSLKNVINPDDVIRDYGADAVRMYEMFMGPLEASKPWSTQGLIGVFRFLEKVWALGEKVTAESGIGNRHPAPDITKLLHRTVKKVTDDTASLNFNTAISAMMIFINEASRADSIPGEIWADFVKLLSVYAPHLGEELWQRLGHTDTIAYEPWPLYNEEYCREDTRTVVVQVNGKIRDKFEAPTGTDRAVLQERALKTAGAVKHLAGSAVVKVIVVPDRLVNIVARPQ
ncbi:MAG: leucine--tRNA ligase [Spirochaetaceae bacterium]|jgi:leucyl-tRNA synthetase|nr:leucine--tRNA ligase [Spirochaetaceae bacterium]